MQEPPNTNTLLKKCLSYSSLTVARLTDRVLNIHVLTESLYGTVALGTDSESWLANVDITLSNVISDLSTSAALEQLSAH